MYKNVLVGINGLIDNYSADMCPKEIAKGFIGLRWVFVELLKKNEVSNLSKYTVVSVKAIPWCCRWK